jgi:nicotinamidase-related amidase
MPGKFDTIQDILDHKHTVLVVWDVQNMLVENIFNKDEFLSNLHQLISTARKMQMPVIYTKITPLPEQFESPARKYYYGMLQKKRLSQKQVDNPMELAVAPDKNEYVINKSTANIFVGTLFELILKNTKRETVIFTGIATEYGIETSARDTFAHGYFAVVVRDAVSSFDKNAHFHSLENMKSQMILVSTEEVKKIYSVI